MAATNGFLPGGYDDAEDKPMLMTKKTSEGHGITALINRQLQGKSNYHIFNKNIFTSSVKLFYFYLFYFLYEYHILIYLLCILHPS